MVTADQVRALALGLPRAYEAWVRDRAKFRVGRLVFLSIAPDERSIGFGYPKDARASLVAAEPEKFFLPIASDMRYHWVRAWLDALEEDEMQELVTEASRRNTSPIPGRAESTPPRRLRIDSANRSSDSPAASRMCSA